MLLRLSVDCLGWVTQSRGCNLPWQSVTPGSRRGAIWKINGLGKKEEAKQGFLSKPPFIRVLVAAYIAPG